MKPRVVLTAMLCAMAVAQNAPNNVLSVPIPRDKVSLTCTDDFFKTERIDFLLEDENYTRCVLRVPLDLKKRWPGRRTFYVVPRVSASLSVTQKDGKQRWVPLAPLNDPGIDPLHGTLDSVNYKAIELQGQLGKVADRVSTGKANAVSAGGKITVCAAPVLKGEFPCTTFDLAARFKVYLR